MDNLVSLPTQDEIDKIRGYRVTKWGGYDNYECLSCQYSTLWPQKMDLHIQEDEHPWAFPGQSPADPTDEDFVTPEY